MKDEKTTEEKVVDLVLYTLLAVCVLMVFALFIGFFPASVPAFAFVGALAWAIYKKLDL